MLNVIFAASVMSLVGLVICWLLGRWIERRVHFPRFCDLIGKTDFVPDFEEQLKSNGPFTGHIRLYGKGLHVLYDKISGPKNMVLPLDPIEDVLFEKTDDEIVGFRWFQVKIAGNVVQFFTIGNRRFNRSVFSAKELQLLRAVV